MPKYTIYTNFETIFPSRHNPRAANAFPVQAPPNYPKYRYRQIAVTPFCRFCDLTPERTMLFPTIRLDATGKMLLEITTAVPIGKRASPHASEPSEFRLGKDRGD